ncbi:peptidase, M1 superfamily, putative [Geotalea daltonii FRC-32]|uniref:Peptidase, M1 superfamily, putative n=1 Tax=Geotalea daltonii (strain DSM 22248 / JCM 15807 / FRC-32) TaxID=316067 RepID=B9M6B3_GEODF|nr:M1 family aminopeptidase [Geotalea daltonii]ACM21901.1 peptidase, M1 superfamily, putative [Geotalea daltonii FRC-32]
MRVAIQVIIGLLLVLPCHITVLAAGMPAVERQELKVTLVPDRQLLKGESLVTFAASSGRVFLNLSSVAAIDTVSVAGKEVHYTFSGGALAVDLPGGGKKASATVHITYHAAYGAKVPERPVSSEDPTYGVTGAITSAGVFLGSDAGWYPAPQVLPEYRRTEIFAPAGMEAITSGKRLERSTAHNVSHSVWEEARPVGELSLSAGPYVVQERQLGHVDIYTYLYPQNAGLGKKYLDAAVKYIGMYTELFGPYPFDKFAAVENFFPTGYGYPSYTLMGSTVIRLPFIVDTSFPHEIAHCWWGNGVQVDYREGNWSEGLVTYLADYLLEEKKSPAAARDYRLRLLSDYSSLVKADRDFPLQKFMGRVDPASRAIGYGKGAMVFHMVRTRIGDRAFFHALKTLNRDFLFRAATWSDFIRAFSKTSGQDLGPFMRQWLTRFGGPALSFDKVTRRRKGGGWQLSGTIVQEASPAYELTLPLLIETERGNVQRTLVLSAKRTAFNLPVRYRPKRIILDPGADVFRILSAEELPPAVNLIKGAKDVALVVTDNCQADEGTLHDLLESLGQGRAPIVTEKNPGKVRLADHDLLFCGVPQQKHLSLDFPAGIKAAPKEFTIDDIRYKDYYDLLFVVTQHPLAVGKLAALLLPLSQDAAQKYALKITHYGKYGYLVFSGGENRRKGTFSPAGNVVEFRDKQ